MYPKAKLIGVGGVAVTPKEMAKNPGPLLLPREAFRENPQQVLLVGLSSSTARGRQEQGRVRRKGRGGKQTGSCLASLWVQLNKRLSCPSQMRFGFIPQCTGPLVMHVTKGQAQVTLHCWHLIALPPPCPLLSFKES